ncbi:glycosyltransferase family 4 protein [Robertkochia marina]|uniref:Glycosyltransferase family 4 protein n=1 Tax=Robertkochia marina TaxID=1227945 RepID=A0A4S3LYU4_9FLAO|nr:glycosyltransferase family 4 protein [Robertkochia marina]THD66798.1 glycosyltransferase family 4 protein [Robertkochia marina]TRZ41911.1 glycosyltransferase family 4 protein [Robertkochia marina]
MKILVYTSDYPSPTEPDRGVFVYNLIQKFVLLGHQVTVIVPYSKLKNYLKSEKVNGYGQERARVYRLSTLSTSAKRIGKYNTYQIGEYFTVKKLQKLVKETGQDYDFIYAHFLTNGIIAVKALSHLNIPIFVAMGESNLDDRISLIPARELEGLMQRITGFVVVAYHLKEKLLSLGVEENRIGVYPNGVDLKKFHKMDQVEARLKLGIGRQEKVLVFVGRFLPHKGPDRVIEAIEKIDKDVKLILIGKGDMELNYKGILFKGAIPSHLVPLYLNAADIFILPTLREGASNAIVEAMACGLPIISSDIPEVKEQCRPSFSRLVDPLDVDKIAESIEELLYDEALLKKMSESALMHSAHFDIDQRAENILEFISQKCNSEKLFVEDSSSID